MESRELRELRESRDWDIKPQNLSARDALRFCNSPGYAQLNLSNPSSETELNHHTPRAVEAKFSPPPTRVILVRHGRSTFNEQGRYQGSSDEAVLIEKGRLDARQIGAALKGLHIDTVYASPLRRVQETVCEILDTFGTDAGNTPIQISAELREIDLPAWQGLPFKYVREQLVADYQCWKQRPHEFQMQASDNGVAASSDRDAVFAIAAPPTTFPVLDLYQRAEQFWREVLPRHAGQTLLLVSHGGTNHALISTALGISPSHHHALQQSNCGVSLLTFSASDRSLAQLDNLNLTTPLGETLPKLKEGKQGIRLLLTPSDAIQDRQCQHLAEFLNDIPIDFSLSETLDPCHKAIDQILRHHSSTLHLQIQRQDFPQAWRHTLQTTPGISTQLITGFVVANSTHIKHLLGQAIGLNPNQYWRLQIHPGTVSVLHYPSVSDRPVLQALNIDPKGCHDDKMLLCE